LNEWDNALAATQEMLTNFPDHPSALYNLGAIYANTSRLDEARTTWQRVAAQSQDPSMKAKAEASLKQLDAMQS
jgi:regulator of sirC expression with transglutaminase-like and TPR domain